MFHTISVHFGLSIYLPLFSCTLFLPASYLPSWINVLFEISSLISKVSVCWVVNSLELCCQKMPHFVLTLEECTHVSLSNYFLGVYSLYFVFSIFQSLCTILWTIFLICLLIFYLYWSLYTNKHLNCNSKSEP